MIQPEEPRKKGSFLERLPKLGRVSQLVLLVGVFLIISIPLLTFYQQQPARRAELEHELLLLEKILAAPTTQKEELEAEISQIEAETEAATEVFPAPAQVPEITGSLLDLAEDNDIDVLGVREPTWQETIGESTFLIDLEGQVPRFQNFILALDSKFHTCQVREVDMLVACEQGEEDTATVIIDVFFGGDHVKTFAGAEDETTRPFHIAGSKWCIYWRVESEDSDDVRKARLSFFVYPEGETGKDIKNVTHSGGSGSGTTYIREGKGDFYIKVEANEIKSWKLQIYELHE